MNYVARAQEVLDMEIAGLQKVRAALGPELEAAVTLILQRLAAGGKVVVTGMGKSLHIGQKIAATLTSTGSPAVVLHPAEAMHGDLGILDGRDVLLALSYSGASEELLQLLPAVRRQGAAIIALTGEPESPLARASAVAVPVRVDREACPFNMAPTTSTTAMLAVGDAIAMVLLEARGFQKEDYAKLHPGGAIGRTLLLRVEDIMRHGERVAQVPAGTPVKQAVLAMTSARAGSVAVLDAQQRVLGIFTDGDLRRHINDPHPVSERRVEELMTPRPIAVRVGQLAVDVLALYEQHNIDDLLVLDAEGRLAGMVDIQDLPKMKIL